MGSSLRDQLLKAGLVDEKRAQEVEREKKRKAKAARKARKSGRPAEPTAGELAARKAREERERQARRSRELNRARAEERARRELRAQVAVLVEKGAQSLEDGQIRYHFTENKRIKRLYVTRAQQQGLARGDLGIVRWEGRHHLVPADVAEKIKEKAPDVFVFLPEPERPDPDDPYAEFPIPEDLEW